MKKKSWEIVIGDDIDPAIKRRLKRILEPYTSVRQPDKCYLCGTATTWVINKKHVCPACSGRHGFFDPDYLPDPCEVCGQQGEWCTSGDPIRSLCFIHRDAWLHWENPELKLIDRKKEPEKWQQVWEEGWNKFVSVMKERLSAYEE